MEKNSKRVEIEGEIGRIVVERGSKLVPEHQPKERICTLCQKELCLMAGASLSYHKGLELINRVLHRGGIPQSSFVPIATFVNGQEGKWKNR